jgi:hypothetical protein
MQFEQKWILERQREILYLSRSVLAGIETAGEKS